MEQTPDRPLPTLHFTGGSPVRSADEPSNCAHPVLPSVIDATPGLRVGKAPYKNLPFFRHLSIFFSAAAGKTCTNSP